MSFEWMETIDCKVKKCQLEARFVTYFLEMMRNRETVMRLKEL